MSASGWWPFAEIASNFRFWIETLRAVVQCVKFTLWTGREELRVWHCFIFINNVCGPCKPNGEQQIWSYLEHKRAFALNWYLCNGSAGLRLPSPLLECLPVISLLPVGRFASDRDGHTSLASSPRSPERFGVQTEPEEPEEAGAMKRRLAAGWHLVDAQPALQFFLLDASVLHFKLTPCLRPCLFVSVGPTSHSLTMFINVFSLLFFIWLSSYTQFAIYNWCSK